jgi:hypothetical protein
LPYGCAVCDTIDPARKQWHRIPTHFRKKRGNGWGTLTVFNCRINSRADCSEMREGLQLLLSFHSETCFCSGEKQAAERGDARLLWQGDGVQGLKPDPLFLLLLWPG